MCSSRCALLPTVLHLLLLSCSVLSLVMSCVAPGKGLDLVRLFYSLLPQRHRWVEAQSQAAVFIIDETFAVPGVGTVVAGGCMPSAQPGTRAYSSLPHRCAGGG